MNLPARDYKKILEVIDLIYSDTDPEQMFRLVCEKLEKLIGMSTGQITRFHLQYKTPQIKDFVYYNIPPYIHLLFVRHYHRVNPPLLVCKKLNWQLPVNTAIDMREFISDAELKETEYHRDFQSLMSIFYEIGAPLATQGELWGMVGFHRPRQDGAFTGREKEILDLIFPHLARALHIHDLQTGKELSADCGVIDVGADGKVLSMNEEARWALDGRPVSALPQAGRGAKKVFFKNGPHVYRVRTIPFRWGSIAKTILLEPCPYRPKLEVRLKDFGLTKRQEEVAVLTIRGLSNKDIAARLFICEQTVKDHLRDIFEKAGVRRRSELTARVLVLGQIQETPYIIKASE